ncbi:MAG: nickel-dependent lactate racemase [Coriobacteriaceae bacterium]|nr:MAG: nickel-dependent lactate racemase [Coriobacteriaceae bacterium]
MRYEVGIGNRTERFELPQEDVIEVMHANPASFAATGEKVVRDSIEHPIGTARLRELVHAGQSVCVITSDVTRPLPTATVLPPVMDELHAAGVRDEDVLLAIALGSHRPQTDDELRTIMGPYYGRLRVLNGDSKGLKHFGYTSHGTPVDVLQEVAAADVRVSLGNVEYHYFAGYSGGAKAIMPGCSTFQAIQANHSLMVDPAAHSGNMESPVRLDLEEACGMVGLDFIVNVVLDEEKNVVYSAAGDFVAAQRDACRRLDALYGCELREYADVVVVSQGGAPKDLNLYQLQKALDNAKHPVREGGTIVLVGSCAEGLGQETFASWMHEASCPQDVVDHLRRDFRLGGHKAAAIAQIELRNDIYLVSDIRPEVVLDCFMTPFSSVQDAVDAAMDAQRKRLGREPRMLIMPHGGSTLPLMRVEGDGR